MIDIHDEIGTCPHVQVHLKLYNKTPFCVHPYVMKGQLILVTEKEINFFQK